MRRTACALALLSGLAGCRTSSARRLFSSSDVDVLVSGPRVEGDDVEVDAVVLRPRGAARIAKAEIVAFDDANENERADAGEWTDRIVGRPDGAEDVALEDIVWPRRPRLTAEITVVVDGGEPLVLRWAVLEIRLAGGA